MKAQNFQVQAQAVEVVARKGGAIEQGMKAWANMTPEQKEKVARFGEAYGAGPDVIRRATGMTDVEIKAALDKFYAAYPHLRPTTPVDDDRLPGVH